MSRLHHPKAGFWIRLCVAVLYPLDALLFRIRWRNLERMPAPGTGVIVAVNHISMIDTILMARLIWQTGRIPRFMIKDGVFGLPVLGRIMKGAGQIPVSRGTSDAAKSLDAAVDALHRGECVIIYPEGTITHDPTGWPMQGKTGIARLVLLAPDIPVVPIGQWGAQPRKGLRRAVPSRRTSLAAIGEPLDMNRFRGAESTLPVVREITDTIMTAIRGEVAQLRGETPPETFFQPRKKAV